MHNALTPNTWRFAWRQLRNAPGQTAIVISGLAVGFALALLAAAFIRDKLWADAGVPEAERMVSFEWRLRGPGGSHTEWWEAVPAPPLQAALREAGAPLGPMSKVLSSPLTVTAVDKAGDKANSGRPRSAKLAARLVDPDIEALFGLRASGGNLAAALSSPSGIALTEAGAEKLFGTREALGRQMSVFVPTYEPSAEGGSGSSITLTVMALLPNPSPHGVMGGFEALGGFNSPPAKVFLSQEGSWHMATGQLFARLLPGATPEAVGALAQHLQDQQPKPEGMPADFLKGGGNWAYLRATPLAERVLHGGGNLLRLLQIVGLAVAAGAVLALAAINFINLWSVRALKRQREIGLRKSLGAGAGGLLAQFFAEALLVTLLAGACGLLLAWWVTPGFESLMQHRFDAAVIGPLAPLFTALACLLVAVFSALPLTLIALRVRPAESLAGRSHSEGRAGRWLRRGMTVLQFAAAALFSAAALVVLWQNHHAGRIERGFQIENRLAFDIPFGNSPDLPLALLRRIQAWPEVITAAISQDVPGRNGGQWYSEFQGPGGGAKVNLRTGMNFTPGFLQLYGIPLLAGRLSEDHRAEADARAVVLDRSSARLLGFASPEAAIGQTLGVNRQYEGGKPVSVVAVIEDIRLEGARQAHVPNVLMPLLDVRGGPITVHSRDPEATRKKLNALLLQELPGDTPAVLSVREQQGREYREELRIGQLIAVVGGVALLMAAVGIYALAAYSLRLREREIVLRKLHGAGHGAVARLLTREFGAVLGLGCLIGLPLAALAAQEYLAGFVERAPMGPLALWPLLMAAAALLLVTSAAVLRHLLAAFGLRPLQALQG